MKKKKNTKSITVKEGEVWNCNKVRETTLEIESIPNAEDRMGMRFKVPNGVDIVKKKRESESVKAIPWKMEVPEDGIGFWEINNNRIFKIPMDNCDDRSKKKTIEVNRINGGSKIKISPHPFRKICDIELELHCNSRVLKHRAIKYLDEENAEYLKKINSSDIVFIDFKSKKIIPIRESYTRIFIGDFEVHIANIKYCEGTNIKYEVSYMPVQSETV